MSAPIIFEDRRDGRTDALFGVVTIGAIVPVDDPVARVAWCMFLPQAPTGWRGETDTDAAKRAIEGRARDWLEAAGLAPR